MRAWRRIADGIPTILFFGGLVAIAVLYGMVAAERRWFPYPLAQNAWGAAQAVRSRLFVPDDSGWASDETVRAFGEAGVLRYDPGRAQDGLTLYTSWHAQDLFLVNMEGKTVRRWSLPFSEVAQRVEPDRQTPPDEEVIIRHANLSPSGAITAVYEHPNHTPYGLGLARFDIEGVLDWAVLEPLHHDFALLEDGTVLALEHEIQTEAFTDIPEIDPPFFSEFVTVISSDGQVVDRLSLFEAFANSPFQQAFLDLADLDDPKGDYLHPNDVEIVTHEFASRSPRWEVGQIIVSLLGMDGFAVIDVETRTVVDFLHGTWREQHDPDLLSNGNILLFDNQGDLAAGMQSRILEIDPATQAIVWSYASSEGSPFYSKALGSQEKLANGNVLITESLKGRLLEVTPAGEIVWEFLNPAERNGRHAYIMSGNRLPADFFSTLR